MAAGRATDRESGISGRITTADSRSATKKRASSPVCGREVGARDSEHRARLEDGGRRVVVSMGWLPRLHPMLKAGLTSGSIMSGGDLICQTIEQRSRTFQAEAPPFAVSGVDPAEEASTSGRTSGVVSTVQESMGLANYDLMRTARFFGVGLTLHGPFFKYARFPSGPQLLFSPVPTAVSTRASVAKPPITHR